MPDLEPPSSGKTDAGEGFGLATATFVIVSSMIGVGVLTTSGHTVLKVGSNQLMLGLWAVGGVVALCGALTLAELSAALPRSGGEYVIFRVPGYPWTPALFLVANAALTIAVFAEEPGIAVCSVLSILTGPPVHALMARGRRPKTARVDGLEEMTDL